MCDGKKRNMFWSTFVALRGSVSEQLGTDNDIKLMKLILNGGNPSTVFNIFLSDFELTEEDKRLKNKLNLLDKYAISK